MMSTAEEIPKNDPSFLPYSELITGRFVHSSSSSSSRRVGGGARGVGRLVGRVRRRERHRWTFLFRELIDR